MNDAMSDVMSDQSFQAVLAQGAGDARLRQAAALIHALAPADRRWAIAQLPAQQRDTVEALLAELTAMGLPRERAIVEAALHPASSHARGGASPDVRSVPAFIGHSTDRTEGGEDTRAIAAGQAVDRWVTAHGVPALIRSLSSEPVALLARLLTARDWAWRAEAVRHLQPALRQDVGEAMRLRAEADAGATAADHRLLDLLVQRLDALHPVPARNSGASISGSRHSGLSDGSSILSRLLLRWHAGRSGR
jgi:hypothetical protein